MGAILSLDRQTYCPRCDRIQSPCNPPCGCKLPRLSPLVEKLTLTISNFGIPHSDFTLHLQATEILPGVSDLVADLKSILVNPRWSQDKAQKAFDLLKTVALLPHLQDKLEQMETSRAEKKKDKGPYYRPDWEVNAEINSLRRDIKGAQDYLVTHPSVKTATNI